MEEDGRLGNLLIETATLFLIGRQANVTVSLLPQVIRFVGFSIIAVHWGFRNLHRWGKSFQVCSPRCLCR